MSKSKTKKVELYPRFLNIDLELYSKKKPKQLIKELGKKVEVLYAGKNFLPVPGKYLVALEVTNYEYSEHKIVLEFDRLLSKLSKKARKQWDKLDNKVFDFGYDIHESQEGHSIEVDTNIINVAAKYGASLAITNYKVKAKDWKTWYGDHSK